MSELKKCPFCGGEALLDYDFNGIGVTYGIHCPKCHCAIIDTGTYSKDEAIAAWNRRADVVPVVRCVECKHYNTTGCSVGFGWCESMDRGVSDEFFCSCGRKLEP